MKAAPLLRAWLHRLRASGVRLHTRHHWLGWTRDGGLRFATAGGEQGVRSDAVIFALGGASWPRLGADGTWVPHFRARGIAVAPLQPANCGFDVGWSEYLRTRFAGAPSKSVEVTVYDAVGQAETRRGEFVLTETGVEGSLIYAFAARLRDAIAAQGAATLQLDLAPDRSIERVAQALAQPRGKRSTANHLRVTVGIDGAKGALLRELAAPEDFDQPERLARAIKSLPIVLRAPRPIDEAISTAGGVRFEALDEHLMVRARPGVFCAGEMLDWEAPTGGYLLTACFATGRAAGAGAGRWLTTRDQSALM